MPQPLPKPSAAPRTSPPIRRRTLLALVPLVMGGALAAACGRIAGGASSESPQAGATPTAVPSYTPAVQPPSRPIAGGDLSVNTWGGNALYAAADIVTWDERHPLRFVRVYSSLDPRVTSLGPGWRHSFDLQMTHMAGTNEPVVVGPDGRPDRYTPLPDGRFRPPPGIYAQLIHQPDGHWRVEHPSGVVWYFDAVTHLTAIRAADGAQTTMRRDNRYRLTGIVDPHGRGELTLTYDGDGKLAAVADWSTPPRMVRYAYDERGRLSAVTDAAGGVVRFTYHGDTSRLATIVDGRGQRAVAITYDGEGRVAQREDASGRRIHFAYTRPPDGSGTTTTRFPPSGFAPGWETTSTDTYDRFHRIIRKETRLSSAETLLEEWTYNPALNPTGARRSGFATTPLAGWRPAGYDPLTALPPAVMAPARLVETVLRSLAYDAADLARDDLGRIVGLEGAAVRFADLMIGALGAAPAPDGSYAWQIEYDAGDRPRRFIGRPLQPAGPPEVTALRYDANGNLVELTGPDGRVTRFTYDERDLLATFAIDGGARGQLAYDPRGTLREARVTAADGTTLWAADYAFDGLKRIRRVTQYPAWPDRGQARIVEYHYDATGRATAYSA